MLQVQLYNVHVFLNPNAVSGVRVRIELMHRWPSKIKSRQKEHKIPKQRP